MPDTTPSDRPDPDERPSPGASNPGEPGYDGEVTVGDDGHEVFATAAEVDQMDNRLGLDDPQPVIGGDPEPGDDTDPVTASANPAATEGEAPSG